MRAAAPTGRDTCLGGNVDEEDACRYPWITSRDDRFTLALVLDVGEVLVRHGYPAPTGSVLVDLTAGLFRALHPTPPY